MPINDEVRAAGEALLGQGRAAVEDARRPLLAMVGAGELAVTGLRERVRELPGTGDQVRWLSTRAGELRELVRDRVHDLDAATVRANVEGYLSQARSVYESLAERGEQVMARRGPQHADRPASLTGAERPAEGTDAQRDGDGAGTTG